MVIDQRIPFDGYWFKVIEADDKLGVYKLQRQEQTTKSLKQTMKILKKLDNKKRL
jgi:protein-tyrosine phosphatase